MESGLEQAETGKHPSELVDLKAGDINFHWTSLKRLEKILRRGIYSFSFARRVKDFSFRRRSPQSSPDKVYLTPFPENAIGDKQREVVGIAVKGPYGFLAPVNFRLAPREFVGIVLPDNWVPEDEREFFITKRAEEICKIQSRIIGKEGNLPIYSSGGDLLWPKRMSHEEIVKMLEAKK